MIKDFCCSDLLAVIGFALMALSIIINRKESEKKFAELEKKLSKNQTVSSHSCNIRKLINYELNN